jgi:hypothetical protein
MSSKTYDKNDVKCCRFIKWQHKMQLKKNQCIMYKMCFIFLSILCSKRFLSNKYLANYAQDAQKRI